MLKSLLIISAVQFEANPTLEMLEKHNIEHEYMEIGIGPINAAKSAATLKEKARGKNVIYLGSAGTFDDFSGPYLVTVNQVHWMPTAERMGTAKFMEDLHKPINIVKTGNFDLSAKTVLTSTSVSLDASINLDLPLKSELIENMEAYSVAAELNETAESVDIIFGITNGIGPDGSKDWVKNFKKISTMTAEYLENQLAK
ncbi:MAG: hypothetical protein AB8G05_20650 [Oligoflexales bacterium]